MKLKEDIIIELSEKATLFAMDNKELVDIDFEHLPFRNFTFYYPMSCVSGKITYKDLEEIAGYSGLTNVDPIRLNLIKKELLDRKSYITVNICDNKMYVSIQDYDREPLIEFEITDEKLEPTITYNFLEHKKYSNVSMYNDAKKMQELALTTVVMVFNVIGFLARPKEQVVKTDSPLREGVGYRHKRVPYKSNKQIRYMTKKVYIVDDLEHYAEQRKNRQYNRQVDSWNVRGHWRQYKSGKRVWIEQSVRGRKDAKVKPQTYKITNMEGNK